MSARPPAREEPERPGCGDTERSRFGIGNQLVCASVTTSPGREELAPNDRPPAPDDPRKLFANTQQHGTRMSPAMSTH
jgi:hypothetical protein